MPAGAFDTIRVRDCSRLDDEIPFRFATALNYLIRWSPAVGALVRETRPCQPPRQEQGTFTVEHQARTQGAK